MKPEPKSTSTKKTVTVADLAAKKNPQGGGISVGIGTTKTGASIAGGTHPANEDSDDPFGIRSSSGNSK